MSARALGPGSSFNPMPNLAQPSVVCTLGGKQYRLAWTFRAEYLLEKTCGILLRDGFQPARSAVQMVSILWAALQGNPAPPTLEQVAEMVDYTNQPELIDKLTAAIAAALPAPSPRPSEAESPAEQPGSSDGPSAESASA